MTFTDCCFFFLLALVALALCLSLSLSASLSLGLSISLIFDLSPPLPFFSSFILWASFFDPALCVCCAVVRLCCLWGGLLVLVWSFFWRVIGSGGLVYVFVIARVVWYGVVIFLFLFFLFPFLSFFFLSFFFGDYLVRHREARS